MKLLYFFIALLVITFSGYMVMNNFNFDHVSFSNYLINTTLALLICSLFVVSIIAAIVSKRKQQNKDVMTIRQYYNYKSIR